MAWYSSGSTNAGLVSNLSKNGLIKSERIKNALLAVDRAHFSPAMPYEDSPQPIGHSATISAPHMHAAACESLLPYLHNSARVLDIGSGSGYLTMVLANLVGEHGRVVGIDHIQPLVDLAIRNTAKSEHGRRWLADGKVAFIKEDGRLGYRDERGGKQGEGDGVREGKWDAIHVGAAAREAHPVLIEQLKTPGRLFIPVGDQTQYIWVIDKAADGTVTRKKDMGVRYVPLTDAPNT